MPKTQQSQRTFSEEEIDHIIDMAIQKTSAHYEIKIDKLEREIRHLSAYIEHFETPKKRGRPLKTTLSNFCGIKKKAKKSNYPTKYTVKGMIESIAYLEKIKVQTAKETSKKSVTGKQAIEYWIDKYEARAAGDPYLSQRKKREAVDEWCKHIKYCKDRLRALKKSGRFPNK